ncbi:Acyl-CoA dehydrogenase family member 11 [Auxenochlorella protothecoides]|uniref:Acyl-CoA dehydrogenase family member 11 n=1 Tax=Auxenochlorella protothecoides TaxID=3075 RepID=A0A087SEQ6_AUXPR|nr:Acyl-CoA dehydrogenase family member 11 [Auxenochlorella protothecoides]KFM24210.1 Acyl-CoA dehydrogenase family member 11 [Auxenochlorella protothecoides]
MVLDTSSALRAVSPAMRLDEAALSAYLRKTLGSKAPAGPLEISQFSHGQSNPTYFLKAGGQRFVLRKQPPGKVLQSAHAVDREHLIMSRLANTPVPVPRMMAMCNDPSVLGTPFYIMEHVQGHIYENPGMESAPPEHRSTVYQAMAETLAALHSLDPVSLGLEDFGRAGGYCARQVKRWSAQYQQSILPGESALPEMVALSEWLSENIPAADADPSRTRITHGDFRRVDELDNLVLDSSGKVLAVLDWELSTLGDPFSDLAYNCLAYHLPQGTPGLAPLPKPLPLGIPSEAQYLERYCAARRIPVPPKAEWHFYLALSTFRAAAILAGPSARVQPLLDAIARFIDQRVVPMEGAIDARAHSDQRWTPHPCLEGLKAEARRQGLWNLWIPADMRVKLAPLMRGVGVSGAEAALLLGPGLSNLEYAHCAEAMARSLAGPEVFNCSAPDTGNMEVLARYGTREQQERWLLPLLRGEIRSAFAMTEPDVASSDATNIQARIERRGTDLVLNGAKWWTSGAPDPRCRVIVFMGKSDPSAAPHRQQSMVLVPADAPGVTVVRALPVYGFDDAPHGHAEMRFENVVVPAGESMLLGEGRGFEIAQGRLGPGRLHHCMRLIGNGERALECARARAGSRTAFGRRLREHQAVRLDLARSRLELDAARLVVLEAARALDRDGNVEARVKIAAAKVLAPAAALRVIDRAVQLHGGAGVSDVTPLAHLWANARTLRLADGPDVVHLETVAKEELRRARL